MSLFVPLLLLFALANGDCGFTTLSAKVATYLDAGSFTLSLNKCQGIKSFLQIEYYNQKYEKNVDGAVLFKCSPNNNHVITLQVYDDPECITKSKNSFYSLHLNDTISILNVVDLTIDSFVCGDNCGITSTFASDCRGVLSNDYVHLSVPLNVCTTLHGDFKGVLDVIPSELLPESVVDSMQQTSLNFSCCSGNDNLLVFNHSDTNCANDDVYNVVIIPSDYNGQCYAIGNNQRVFDPNHDDEASSSSIDHNDDVYAFVLEWSCDEAATVDCSVFYGNSNAYILNEMDDGSMPNECPYQCLQQNYQFPTTTEIPETTDSSNGDAKDNGNNGDTQGTSSLMLVVLIVMAVLLFVVIMVGAGYWYFKRTKLKRIASENEENMIGNLNGKGDKYEAMMVAPTMDELENENDNQNITTNLENHETQNNEAEFALASLDQNQETQNNDIDNEALLIN